MQCHCPKVLLCRELKNLCSSGVVRPFVRLSVCNAAIKAIWTFSKFSLILLWKGFGGVTHRQLLDPKFGRFTSKFVDFLDQKWTPKMDSFRHARRATLPCGCNLVRSFCEFLQILWCCCCRDNNTRESDNAQSSEKSTTDSKTGFMESLDDKNGIIFGEPIDSWHSGQMAVNIHDHVFDTSDHDHPKRVKLFTMCL